jgi:ABC-type transporter Mla subunit MlaD
MLKTRYIFLFSIVLVAVFALWWTGSRPNYHAKEIKTYFADAHDLREGTAVDIAGVQIGIVKSVKVRPDFVSAPAEVIMTLQTPYPLEIPADARTSIHQAGLLGGSFVDIDIKNTRGLPVKTGATLQSVQTQSVSLVDVLDRLAKIAEAHHKDEQRKTESGPSEPKMAPGPTTPRP